ncbi:galactose mutarotase-like [Mytilus californianus]|uniref:galactose mutarotase-like n=1 Tax=Mytilus californianus TaxID=6549 RepID=UPI0022478522|nr:galactose mutarotase-like [Mytilus californianus]
MARKDNRRNICMVLCFVTVVIIALLAVVIYLATRGSICPESEMSSISKEEYGEYKGEKVFQYTLQNKNNVKVQIINFGGIITNIFVPDKNGKIADITLGYDSLDRYTKPGPYFGAIIGRYANRIANGTFELDGKNYTLEVNNGPNSLHGGKFGFDKKVWEASEDDDILALKYVSAEMEEGYPGEVTVVVTYMLTEDNELVIHYTANTTKKTVINLTNHAYFNLAGQGTGDILKHTVELNADRYLPVNDVSIPTGDPEAVEGTKMDLRTPIKLETVIDDVPGNVGYDHCYCFSDAGWKKLRARVYEEVSGRKLEVYSTEPGMQFYTGFYLDEPGKKGGHYHKYNGFALEAQHYPDSPHNKNFPSTVLSPGETYLQTTSYKFGLV